VSASPGVPNKAGECEGALKMSKAVIDFCQGLQTSLLAIEERLGKAKQAFDAGRTHVEADARAHVEKASAELDAFKARAAGLAAELRAELPEKVDAVEDKLKEFGQEAQVAMRHAVVFLAEAASKGATAGAGLLHRGAERAHDLAENLRHETAVAVRDPASDPDQAQSSS
jgi:ABC-type transporter Mla subunit MlaD